MDGYLLIESRDLLGADGDGCLSLAVQLHAAGRPVAVFLVQDGVAVVRRGAPQLAVLAALRAGVRLYADEFSLRERGISADQRDDRIEPVPIDFVIQRLADGDRVLWH
jgi:predicted peroxiredoxin